MVTKWKMILVMVVGTAMMVGVLVLASCAVPQPQAANFDVPREGTFNS